MVLLRTERFYGTNVFSIASLQKQIDVEVIKE